MSGIAFQFDPEALTPLVQQVVTETLRQLERDREKVNGKLAYTEAEAAALLSLDQHQLRDLRRRGEIPASRGPGKMVLYTQRQLLDFLAGRHWERTEKQKAKGKQ
jgi:hypothetical protein